MIIVSNTSPIINLAIIDKLRLLRNLFENILIPEAVYKEVVKGEWMAGSDEVEKAKWIKTQKIQNKIMLKSLLQDLHDGEAEAIVLATEKKADFILLDESTARLKAKSLGLMVIGILGILIESKKRKLIPEIKPLLNQLKSSGFWLSESVYQEALKLAKE